MDLPVYDAGDGEVWAVGDETQVNSAVGKEVIEALRHVAPEVIALLAPILGRELTDLMRAAAEPGQREFGLFLYRLR